MKSSVQDTRGLPVERRLTLPESDHRERWVFVNLLPERFPADKLTLHASARMTSEVRVTRSMGIYTRQASGLTKSTGTFDSCKTFNAMLPNIIFFIPVYPWVAITIRSTPFF